MKHRVAQFITGKMEAVVVVHMDQAAHGHC